MIKRNLISEIDKISEELFLPYSNDQKEENKVSELQVHKILYILYGNFYSKFSKELFDAKFQAWQYGPVELDYRKKNNHKFNLSLEEEEYAFVAKTVKNLLRFSPWALVYFTHNTDPWKKNYEKGKNNISISNVDIQKWFEENKNHKF